MKYIFFGTVEVNTLKNDFTYMNVHNIDAFKIIVK